MIIQTSGEEEEGELENVLDFGVAKDCTSHVLEFIIEIL